jgi:hypothetical protein
MFYSIYAKPKFRGLPRLRSAATDQSELTAIRRELKSLGYYTTFVQVRSQHPMDRNKIFTLSKK